MICIESGLWIADCLVFIGACFEVFELRKDLQGKKASVELISSRGTGYPDPYPHSGGSQFPVVKPAEPASGEKKLAAIGWVILTIGLLLEVVLTPIAFMQRSTLDAATDRRIEQL